MYSLKNRAFAGVLALLMLLSMTGCAGTTSGEESSGSTVTQEEYDALKEQNEQLQAELDELKGETDGEAEDGTEPDASGEGGGCQREQRFGKRPGGQRLQLCTGTDLLCRAGPADRPGPDQQYQQRQGTNVRLQH